MPTTCLATIPGTWGNSERCHRIPDHDAPHQSEHYEWWGSMLRKRIAETTEESAR